MSEQSSERGERDEHDGPLSVPDEELPEDLRPGEDNPLAEPAADDVPDDVIEETPSRADQDSGHSWGSGGSEGSEGSEDDASGGDSPDAAHGGDDQS